jgi:hypothetical protein
MKTLSTLLVALLFPTLVHAITVLPTVSVEDKSNCINTQALTDELSSVLPSGRDHHGYAVGVLVQASRDPDSAQVMLTVEHPGAKAPALERTLTVKRGECADASRLLARIAAKAMEGAPESEAGGLGVRGSRPSADDAPQPKKVSVSNDRMPDDWLHFQREVVVTVNSNRYGSSASVNEFEVPVMGPYAKKLEWEEFYQKVGRQDLADTYHSHWIRRNALYWSGIGVAVLTGLVGAVATAAASTGALFFMFWGIRNASSSSSPVSPTILGIGALVAAPIVGTLVTMVAVGAGVAMTWVGVLLPLQPVELHEVKAMADEHNQKLEGASGGGFTPPPATVPAETRT